MLSSGDNEKSQPGKAGFYYLSADVEKCLPYVTLDVRLNDVRVNAVVDTKTSEIVPVPAGGTVFSRQIDLTDTFIPVMGIDDDTLDPFLCEDELAEAMPLKNFVRDGIEVVPAFTADPDNNLG